MRRLHCNYRWWAFSPSTCYIRVNNTIKLYIPNAKVEQKSDLELTSDGTNLALLDKLNVIFYNFVNIVKLLWTWLHQNATQPLKLDSHHAGGIDGNPYCSDITWVSWHFKLQLNCCFSSLFRLNPKKMPKLHIAWKPCSVLYICSQPFCLYWFRQLSSMLLIFG